MSVLRYSLIAEDFDGTEAKRTATVFLICLLISVLIHLCGFFIWQLMDKDAGDKFNFLLVSDIPPIELTLVVNDPELTIEAEAPPAETKQVETGPVPWEQHPGGESFAQALESLALAEAEMVATQSSLVDESPARAEVLPPGEAAAPGQVDPPISLEDQAPARKSYDTAIRMAINKNFIIPPAAKNLMKPGQLVVFFTISRQGQLLRTVVEESSGNASLDHAGLEALSAAVFPPLPPELAHLEQIDIRMTFDFKIVYRRSAGR